MERKIRWLQMRLTDADEELILKLSAAYRMDRSAVVRFALQYLDENRPVFQIIPQDPKVAALTPKMAMA